MKVNIGEKFCEYPSILLGCQAPKNIKAHQEHRQLPLEKNFYWRNSNGCHIFFEKYILGHISVRNWPFILMSKYMFWRLNNPRKWLLRHEKVFHLALRRFSFIKFVELVMQRREIMSMILWWIWAQSIFRLHTA